MHEAMLLPQFGARRKLDPAATGDHLGKARADETHRGLARERIAHARFEAGVGGDELHRGGGRELNLVYLYVNVNLVFSSFPITRYSGSMVRTCSDARMNEKRELSGRPVATIVLLATGWRKDRKWWTKSSQTCTR
ncbi:MAG TPA: hypothetical protein VLW55_19370 [Burkholderiaceae bacterium]|nr:hypothetical protein [Burkholderiaceae bacterium]